MSNQSPFDAQNTLSGERSKKEQIDLQAYLSKKGYSGPNMYYLNDGQIIEFTNPIYTSASKRNVMFSINGSERQKIYFSQIFVVIVDIDDNGEVASLRSPLFPVNGAMKKIIEISAEEFVNIVRNKKYRVSCAQSYIVNYDSKTALEKNLYELYDKVVYIQKCIKENRIKDLGDTLKLANTYSFTEI
ncbi:MAG: hypothetical protein IJU90_07170 [Bacteroidales bacterium]|nr:hypothetical protein [Bacteroidales bacterium]